MKTLEVEQISALQEQHIKLVATARAGATLASFVRGAIRGCDASNDPDGRIKNMLAKLLDLAGFDVEQEGVDQEVPAASEKKRRRCPECNQRCWERDGAIEVHKAVGPNGTFVVCAGSGSTKRSRSANR